jgi:DeoR family transcriptional regulator, fructose operon transcriptional repressor
MGLLAEKRHQYILEQLRSNGRILVATIAGNLDVTEVTIRRDLSLLAKNGLLKKTYGGAVMPGPANSKVSVRFRHTQNIQAKKNIGKLAADLVEDNDIIYLEAGSTCYEIIPYLSKYQDLTIIVNSLNLMRRLHELTKHNVIVTGGQYRPERMDMIGPLAEAAVAQLGGFKAFTGADDISRSAGISGADIATVTFAKIVLKQASKVIFVGDHTKFDKPALYKIADLNALDYIVTDKPLSAAWLKISRKKHIVPICPK